ncbi:Beta-glucosidase 8 [Rhynchospora pubera]|uniref:Beta-glucosidase 8 n=1 Tax=Rhynchospora pubera TaxID=906938 RepID=A0AAV8DMA9_9POAL|nr:Beta-glucosidase 8 [Rhynchospora pubera]
MARPFLISFLFPLYIIFLLLCGGSSIAALSRDDFPSGFIFGAGTSGYQVEGAAAEDGRKPSIWDAFCHAGKMADHSNADVAADQYHKYKEDVKLMHETGLDAYRFSIAWPRLIPANIVSLEKALFRKYIKGLPVAPWGLSELLQHIKINYGNPPIMIHENGDFESDDSTNPITINDDFRINYLEQYLEALHLSIRNGSNTQGYFVWSFLDCFEYLYGYTTRYGIYGVKFNDTEKTRYTRSSARWYANFLGGKTNREGASRDTHLMKNIAVQ